METLCSRKKDRGTCSWVKGHKQASGIHWLSGGRPAGRGLDIKGPDHTGPCS